MPRLDGASRATLGAAITKGASTQSYLTIRWLADRAYRQDAFALYGYFRWLDDEVDERLATPAQRLAFVERQRSLVAGSARALADEEHLLVALLRRREGSPRRDAAGAHAAVRAMLDVIEFDARRRDRRVSEAELARYTHGLAVAVTEALHHCIGHGRRAPQDETRYVAVTGAHIAHMLRDHVADVAAGYVNVPAGVLESGVAPDDVDAPQLRRWVKDRVALARECFATGRGYLARLESERCALAGHAYIARFEWVLDAVERDGYRLRPGYGERSSARGGLAIAASGTRSALASRHDRAHVSRGAA